MFTTDEWALQPSAMALARCLMRDAQQLPDDEGDPNNLQRKTAYS